MWFNDLGPEQLAEHLVARLHPVPTLDALKSRDAVPVRLAAFEYARSLSPDLTYGRHRGSPPTGSRLAAVALVLYQDPERGNPEGGWSLALTRRPTSLAHHGGQICLPGGRIEVGESPIQACLREYEEELGVDPAIKMVAGSLDRQLVYASGNLVLPIVFIGEPPANPWRPDPAEVSEVIEVSLAQWLDPRHRVRRMISQAVHSRLGQVVGELSFDAPGVQWESCHFSLDVSGVARRRQTPEKHFVWGATAMMIEQLARILLLR